MFLLPIGILLKRGSIRVLLYIRPLTYKYEPALGVDSMTNIYHNMHWEQNQQNISEKLS